MGYETGKWEYYINTFLCVINGIQNTGAFGGGQR